MGRLFGLVLYANIFQVLGLSGVSVPQPQIQQQAAPQSGFDLLGGVTNSGPPSHVSSPPPPINVRGTTAQSARSTPDPFAALTSPAPRQASPFQFQQSIHPQPSGTTSGTADLLGVGAPAPSSNLAQSSTAASHDDDEWTFASAVPEMSKEITVSSTSVKVVFTISRESDTVLLIQSRISNNTPAPISELTFQSAVSKVCPLSHFISYCTNSCPGLSTTNGASIGCLSPTTTTKWYHADNQAQWSTEGSGFERKDEVEIVVFSWWREARRKGRNT